jgi:DNA-binding SARP family transcriptional activator/WD40 repeat protein
VVGCVRLYVRLILVPQYVGMDSFDTRVRQSPELADYGRTVSIRVLGPIEVVADGQQLTIGGERQRTVLALLVASAGTAISSDKLVQGVWGDDAPPGTRRSLSTYLSNLRSEIGDVIRRQGSGYVLEIDRAAIDAFAFEDMVAVADDLIPREVSNTLREALAMWRGHPYADVDGYMALDGEIARLNELRMVSLEKRIDADLDAGHHREVLGELDALTSEYPLRERFRAQQMIALFRAGRQAEALRAYQMTRQYLGTELGIEPSNELRDLEQRILDQDATLIDGGDSTIVQRAILVIDAEYPEAISALAPSDRDRVIDENGQAVERAVEIAHGAVFSYRGSAMYTSFKNAGDAVEAARLIQTRLSVNLLSDDPRFSIAIDVGDVELLAGGTLSGPPIVRAATLVAAAQGNQVLLSAATHAQLTESPRSGWQIRSLGEHALPGVGEPLAVYQLVIEGVDDDPRALRTDARPSLLPLPTLGVPGYEMREQAGEGPFGVVHSGYQPTVGRQVAIKVFRPKFVNAADFIRHFEVGAQLVARLEHPHIVPLYDYWRDPDGAYLVMRRMAGGSLDDKLRSDGPMTLDDAAAMVTQLAPAVDAAHRVGVIHRDIKPSNVMIDTDGNLYLSDFGIAYDVLARSNRGPEPGVDVGPVDERVDVAGFGNLLKVALGWSNLDDGESAGDTAHLPQSVMHVLEVACAADPIDRYASMVISTQAWENAIQDADVATEVTLFTPSRNPYQGLSAFEEPDAEDFYGRDSEIAALLDALVSNRLVAVVGPSGIGKSSLVKAGLIPALRSGALPRSADWLITDMVPGPYAFEEMASALLRIAMEHPHGLDDDLRSDRRGLLRAARRLLPPHSESLIVIDQFEEVFTMGTDLAETDQFIEALTTLVTDPSSNSRVVVTLRADFFDLPMRYHEFGELLKYGIVPVTAPGRSEIEAIVTEPAAALGVGFEPGLVESILSSVARQVTVLPLLEFALTDLFEQRTSNTLARAQYEAGGGIQGAVGHHAERVYLGLGDAGRTAARDIFLRLVAISESSEPTGRRAKRTELDRFGAMGGCVTEVLERFGEARLIAFDRDQITRGPVVHVAHEAIFTHWERLEHWIDEQRADLMIARHLNKAAAEWENAGRDTAYLVVGGRLAQFTQWEEDTDLAISLTESEYVSACVEAESDKASRRRRTRTLVVAGFAAVAVVASLLAVAALVARGDAQAQAAAADRQALILQATLQTDRDPELGMLLALEALDSAGADASDLPEGVVALRAATEAQRLVSRYDGGGFVEVSPDGLLMATEADTDVAIIDIETGDITIRLDQPNASATHAGFGPDGRLVVGYRGLDPSSSGWDPVLLWDISDGTFVPLGEAISVEGLELPLAVDDVEMSGDGELVAATVTGVGTLVWSVTSGEHLYTIPADGSAAFHPVDDVLAVSGNDGSLGLYDSETGALLRHIDTGVAGWIEQVFSPDGSVIAIESQQEGKVIVFDVASGEQVMFATVYRPGGLAWFSDGQRLVVGGDGGILRVLDAGTGAVIVDLLGHQSTTWSVATVKGRDLAVSAGLTDGATIVWSTAEGPRTYLSALETDIATLRTSEYLDGGRSSWSRRLANPVLPGSISSIRVPEDWSNRTRTNLSMGGLV